MHTLLRYLGTVGAVMLTVRLVPGVSVSGLPAATGPAQVGDWTTLFLVALVWSVIVFVVRPVLSVLTLPITILTLGLFSFILNAALFYAMTYLVPGFVVEGFVSALLGALVLSLATWFIEKIL